MADPEPMPNSPPTDSNNLNPFPSVDTSGGEPLETASVEGGELNSTREAIISKAEEELTAQGELLTPPRETTEEKKENEPPAPPFQFRKTLYQMAMAKVLEEEETAKAAKLKEEAPKEIIPPLPPPTPEKRAAPYIRMPNPKVLFKIDRELRDSRYYLMGKKAFGDPKVPDSCSFFVIGDIGKRCEVKLRTFPSCHCGDFLEDRLCKHIMFIMMKFFKLKKYDPLIWQTALLSTELRTLLSDPRITFSSKAEIKRKFVSKLFPPKVAPPVVDDNPPYDSAEPEKGLAPQFCPVCLEQFNFIADTPEKLYIGPIPWKPKFMPKLDMGPPKCIQEYKDEKARLESAIKKHEEELALAKQGELDTDSNVPKEDAKGEENIENKTQEGGMEKTTSETKNENTDSKTTIVPNEDEKKDDELDQPLRKYEPIWFCPKLDCKGDNVCFKIVHEWCYKKIDNFGIYPRGKQCPVFGLM